jgi:UPF0716 family protein affecting phage T7 exclusion
LTIFAFSLKDTIMRMRVILMTMMLALGFSLSTQAQCSICTKTAQQLGEKPAKALNGAIIYLAAAPLLMIGIIGYRWYKSNRG